MARRGVGGFTCFWAAIACASLGGCFAPQPLQGPERWQKFRELRSPNAPSWKPDFTINKRRFRPGDEISFRVAAPVVSYFYVFLLLPNNDLYLLVPSPKVKDHRGRSLEIPPPEAEFEFIAPAVPGIFYLGVIAADQSINLLSEGWIPAIGKRTFSTWPRDLALDDALDFIDTGLEDRSWATAEQSFEVIEVEEVESVEGPKQGS